MKKALREVYLFLKNKYTFYKRTSAFNLRYQKYDQSLFKENVDESIIREYKDKWSKYGKKVETKTFMLSYNLSGKIDYKIVPENLFAAIIEKKLNPYRELSLFSVKNIYEKWFDNKEVFPKSYFHRIAGLYYDRNFHIIPNIKEFIEISTFDYPLILKPSKDTYGGSGVTLIKNKGELHNIIQEFEHFVCQECIYQNEYLRKVNNSSINSVRSCLYRDKTGEFKVVNNSIRFGIHGGLDNETSGGIVCNIKDNGQLSEYAVDKYANKFLEHPNSHIRFPDLKIPMYEELSKVAVEIANQIPLCNLVSLDMCLDNNNKWRCIEINLSGQTIRFAQYAGRGFFGKYTEEVIEKTATLK